MWSDAPRSVGPVGATNRTVMVPVTVVVRICLANSHSPIGADASRSVDSIGTNGSSSQSASETPSIPRIEIARSQCDVGQP